jgi:hypothetical protein
VQLDEVLEQPLDVVERVRALRVAASSTERQISSRRLAPRSVELLLKRSSVAEQPRPAQERQPRSGSAAHEVSFVFTGHC